MKKVVFVLGLRTLMWPKGSRTAWWERMWLEVMRVDRREVMFFIVFWFDEIGRMIEVS